MLTGLHATVWEPSHKRVPTIRQLSDLDRGENTRSRATFVGHSLESIDSGMLLQHCFDFSNVSSNITETRLDFFCLWHVNAT